MRNIAEIDLNALKQNAIKIRRLIGKNCLFCAVVKADAYGHGASVCANTLYPLVDAYAVALVEEGIELRRSGIDKPILVLVPPLNADIQIAIEYGLTLTVDSLERIKKINRAAKGIGIKAKVHVKYNTGMNRFGVNDLNALGRIFEYNKKKNDSVEISGLFSHFAAPEKGKCLKKALDKFLLAINVAKGYNKNIICHISASGGLLAGVKLDMVRVGIMLYGYTPYKTDIISLKPVMKVKAPVIVTRAVKKGTSVLYGSKKLEKGASFSIVRYGYADGLFRSAIKGQINSRCMDVTAVKTADKKRNINVLDDAAKIAKKYGTISYEILTKAAIRAEKRYWR